jgi:hypothetical protein
VCALSKFGGRAEPAFRVARDFETVQVVADRFTEAVSFLEAQYKARFRMGQGRGYVKPATSRRISNYHLIID